MIVAEQVQTEQMIDLVVDGTTTKEPLSKVVERAQKATAVERRLEEIARTRAELQQRAELMDGQLRFSERFQTMMAADPDALVAEVARMARTAKGGDVVVPGAETNSDGGGAAPAGRREDPAILQALRGLEDQIRQVKTETSVDRLTRDIGSELTRYPLFNDPSNAVSVEAREQAEFLMRAMRAANPSASLSDLATQVHARVSKLVTQGAQQQHDTRVATAAAVPNVRAESGTPAVHSDEWKPTVASMKDEGPNGLRARMRAAATRVLPTR